jgi:hypothetical protein
MKRKALKNANDIRKVLGASHINFLFGAGVNGSESKLMLKDFTKTSNMMKSLLAE